MNWLECSGHSYGTSLRSLWSESWKAVYMDPGPSYKNWRTKCPWGWTAVFRLMFDQQSMRLAGFHIWIVLPGPCVEEFVYTKWNIKNHKHAMSLLVSFFVLLINIHSWDMSWINLSIYKKKKISDGSNLKIHAFSNFPFSNIKNRSINCY